MYRISKAICYIDALHWNILISFINCTTNSVITIW